MEQDNRDFFDKAMGALMMRGDVVRTDVSVKRIIDALGSTQTYSVQTFRTERDRNDKSGRQDEGDTVFIEHTSAEHGFRRFVVLPAVSEIVARQRDALSTKMRKRGAAKAKETKRQKKAGGR